MELTPEQIHEYRMKLFQKAMEERTDVQRTIHNLNILIEHTPADLTREPIMEVLTSAVRHLEMLDHMYGSMDTVESEYGLMDQVIQTEYNKK